MSSDDSARTVILEEYVLVQDRESLFASYKVLTLLWRYPWKTAGFHVSKIFHDIAFNQKSQFSIWKQVWTLHFTACSTVYSLQLQYLHLYSSLFMFCKKKKKQLKETTTTTKLFYFSKLGICLWLLSMWPFGY